MGALGSAFDVVVVGALALSWVLLVIHLFFSDNESTLKKLLDWVRDQQQPALAGILLFAMAYPMGSVVSRIAQDFFDDDDLHFHAFHHLFRVGVTESGIRTDVFCTTFKPEPSDPRSSDTPAEKTDSFGTTASKPDSKPKDALAKKGEKFRSTDPNCTYTGRWYIQTFDPNTNQHISAVWIKDQQDRAGDVFHVHEATVLLKGTDATEKIRQFHDQIIVLRGAAFNGMLAFSLCMFWWTSSFRSVWRWSVLSVHLVLGVIATYNHFNDHIHDPPYMEFTFFVLVAAGICLLWQRRPRKEEAHGELPHRNGIGEIRFVYLILSAFLAISAFLGWWATQVLYDQQIIYSYKALTEAPSEAVKPIPK